MPCPDKSASVTSPDTEGSQGCPVLGHVSLPLGLLLCTADTGLGCPNHTTTSQVPSLAGGRPVILLCQSCETQSCEGVFTEVTWEDTLDVPRESWVELKEEEGGAGLQCPSVPTS